MDKVLLITGASRGIGAATARLAAQQGWAVAVNYHHNRTAAEAVVADIHAAGGRAVAIAANVADEVDVQRLFAECEAALGPLLALVNNAGVLEPQMRLDEMSAARWQRILGTNVIGPLLCCREAVKRLSTRHGGPGGAIVNVSSAAARLGSPGEYVDYAAAKGAVDVLTRGLSLEVAAQGIRVNGVRPGFIYTDMHADGGEPGRVDRVKGQIPLQRGGQPAEVAAAIAWLLSDEASYVTGTFIDVAGGR